MFVSGWRTNDIGCRTLLRWWERSDYVLHFVVARTVCFTLIHVVKVLKIIICACHNLLTHVVAILCVWICSYNINTTTIQCASCLCAVFCVLPVECLPHCIRFHQALVMSMFASVYACQTFFIFVPRFFGVDVR